MSKILLNVFITLKIVRFFICIKITKYDRIRAKTVSIVLELILNKAIQAIKAINSKRSILFILMKLMLSIGINDLEGLSKTPSLSLGSKS
jgi:hypothetical protein